MSDTPPPSARQEFRQLIARTTYDEAIVSLEAGFVLEADGNWIALADLAAHRRRAFWAGVWSWAQFLFYCGFFALFGFALVALVTLIV
ncbi:MAG: hypothetical protein N4A61_12975 [Pelagimonas sp.]|jgi:hypothetical protein|nr:hypothetical protein [Pelagimonas sp.]